MGDDPNDPDAAYIQFTPRANFHGSRKFRYVVEDLAPKRIVNGVELDEANPAHTARRDSAWIRVF
ncbi:MAG: hypothetical protein KDA54_09820 [Phycisphaerales bacterium]|nr:hypothetical protein [Phycisphaerales bacterium]